VAIPPPAGVTVIPVVSAADMLEAVLSCFDACDALVMSAAVADWRPKAISHQKLKKGVMSGTLELERTVDILNALRERRRPDHTVVGFAAETEHVLESARGKCLAKGLDMVVANDVGRTDAGFEVDTNAVCLVDPLGIEELPLMSKAAVAERIVAWIEHARSARGL